MHITIWKYCIPLIGGSEICFSGVMHQPLAAVVSYAPVKVVTYQDHSGDFSSYMTHSLLGWHDGSKLLNNPFPGLIMHSVAVRF